MPCNTITTIKIFDVAKIDQDKLEEAMKSYGYSTSKTNGKLVIQLEEGIVTIGGGQAEVVTRFGVPENILSGMQQKYGVYTVKKLAKKRGMKVEEKVENGRIKLKVRAR